MTKKISDAAAECMRRINTETRIGANKVIDPDHAAEIIDEFLDAARRQEASTNNENVPLYVPQDGMDSTWLAHLLQAGGTLCVIYGKRYVKIYGAAYSAAFQRWRDNQIMSN